MVLWLIPQNLWVSCSQSILCHSYLRFELYMNTPPLKSLFPTTILTGLLHLDSYNLLEHNWALQATTSGSGKHSDPAWTWEKYYNTTRHQPLICHWPLRDRWKGKEKNRTNALFHSSNRQQAQGEGSPKTSGEVEDEERAGVTEFCNAKVTRIFTLTNRGRRCHNLESLYPWPSQMEDQQARLQIHHSLPTTAASDLPHFEN